MNRLRLFVLIALAACWLPATSHCALEAAEFVSSHCCESDDGATAPADCSDEMCCAWESALAQPGSILLVKSPLAMDAGALSAALVVVSAPRLTVTRLAESPRPPWISSWQFERRTALPVRAPAVV